MNYLIDNCDWIDTSDGKRVDRKPRTPIPTVDWEHLEEIESPKLLAIAEQFEKVADEIKKQLDMWAAIHLQRRSRPDLGWRSRARSVRNRCIKQSEKLRKEISDRKKAAEKEANRQRELLLAEKRAEVAAAGKCGVSDRKMLHMERMAKQQADRALRLQKKAEAHERLMAAERSARLDRYRKFVRLAKERMSREEFDALWEEANRQNEGEEQS